MIPKFKFYFYPFLKNLADRESCRLFDLARLVAKDLGLSEEDLSENTKSGRQSKHCSRVNYCASYLKKMKLVEAFSTGSYKITQRGKEVLKKYGANLTLSELRELPEYLATQINTENTDIVYVQSHKRGDRIIGPYTCNKKMLNAKNPNIIAGIHNIYREALAEKSKM